MTHECNFPGNIGRRTKRPRLHRNWPQDGRLCKHSNRAAGGCLRIRIEWVRRINKCSCNGSLELTSIAATP